MRDYVDARINEVNANIESAQTKIDADLTGMTTELKRLPGTWTFVSVVATGFVILLAVLALMGDRFDAGLGFSVTSTKQAEEAVKTAKDAKEATETLSKNIDIFSQEWVTRAERIDKLLPKLEALVQPANNEPPKKGEDLLEK
jgi:prefoldin subunit 5